MKRGGLLRRTGGLSRTGRLRARPHPERAAIRAEVFARDGHECRWAYAWHEASGGDPYGTAPTACHGELTVHHVRKASGGGAYRPDNLISLCAGHNDLVETEPATARAMGLVCRPGDADWEARG